jgi:hypothetical protein
LVLDQEPPLGSLLVTPRRGYLHHCVSVGARKVVRYSRRAHCLPRGALEEVPFAHFAIIDGAQNSVYDIFQATEDEFAVIFPDGTDVAFSDEVAERGDEQSLIALFSKIWERRIPKKDAQGIHGTIFYGLPEKKQYYPTRKDEEAINPNGTRLR